MNVLEHYNIKPHYTFGIDVWVKAFYVLNDIRDIEYISDIYMRSHPLLILGGGSNILFIHQAYQGTVVCQALKGIAQVDEDMHYRYIKAAAGEEWHALVSYCLVNKWGGLENLSLIPGTVGAAPIQNIGAYGVEVKDVFYSLEWYDFINKKIKIFYKEDCNFGYRDSIFKHILKNKGVILSVTFQLPKQPQWHIHYHALKQALANKGINNHQLSAQIIADTIIDIRRSKLPAPSEYGNAGSFFKNPMIPLDLYQQLQKKYTSIPTVFAYQEKIKIPAAWLLEEAGWKGKKNKAGTVSCYHLQPLVIINEGGATGQDIWEFAQQIIISIKEKFNITLEPEVNIIL